LNQEYFVLDLQPIFGQDVPNQKARIDMLLKKIKLIFSSSNFREFLFQD